MTSFLHHYHTYLHLQLHPGFCLYFVTNTNLLSGVEFMTHLSRYDPQYLLYSFNDSYLVYSNSELSEN